MGDSNQGWESWSNHVLMTLEKLEKKVDVVDQRINDTNLTTQVEIVSIKSKAAVWGLVAGFMISTVVSIFVGVLVYQLTMGSSSTRNNKLPINNSSGIYMLLPRDNNDYLKGFKYGVDFDEENIS